MKKHSLLPELEKLQDALTQIWIGKREFGPAAVEITMNSDRTAELIRQRAMTIEEEQAAAEVQRLAWEEIKDRKARKKAQEEAEAALRREQRPELIRQQRAARELRCKKPMKRRVKKMWEAVERSLAEAKKP